MLMKTKSIFFTSWGWGQNSLLMDIIVSFQVKVRHIIGGKRDWNYSMNIVLLSVLLEGSTDEWYKYSVNHRQ